MTAHVVNGELGGYPAVHPRGRPPPGRQGAEPPAETGWPAEDPLHLGPTEGVLPRRGYNLLHPWLLTLTLLSL